MPKPSPLWASHLLPFIEWTISAPAVQLAQIVLEDCNFTPSIMNTFLDLKIKSLRYSNVVLLSERMKQPVSEVTHFRRHMSSGQFFNFFAKIHNSGNTVFCLFSFFFLPPKNS